MISFRHARGSEQHTLLNWTTVYEAKEIVLLRSKIAELSGVLREFSKGGVVMSLDLIAFRYLTDLLREYKEELALRESEEIMTTFKQIMSN